MGSFLQKVKYTIITLYVLLIVCAVYVGIMSWR